MLRSFFLILVLFLSVGANAATYTWIGTTSDWNSGANWNQGGTIPGPDDFVVINNNGTSNPLLSNDVTIARLTISNKILDLGGYVLTSTGLSTLSGGEIRNGRFEFNNTTANLTFSGTLINVPVQAAALNVFLNGSIFNFPARLTIINNTSHTSAGGNVFNDTLTINHEGIQNIFLGNSSPDIFNGIVRVNIRNSYNVYLAYNSQGNQFNNNVILTNTSSYLSSTGGGTVFFSNTANGSSILAAGKKILIGPEGFTTGTILLRNFIQLGNDSMTFNLSGERTRVILRDNVFNGPVTVVAPEIHLNGGHFNADAYFEKTGPYDNYGNGGNVFNGKVELRNTYQGALTGALGTGNGVPDTFNLDVTLTNYSTRQVAVASSSAGNYFGGNVFLRSDSATFTSLKIFYIGRLLNSTFEFQSGKSILLHDEGFGKGEINIRGGKLVQQDTLSFTLDGNDAYVSFTDCDFSCPVVVRASSIRLSNSVFRQKCYFEKTYQTPGVHSPGGNAFLKPVELINSGSTGYTWARSVPDIFYDTLVVRTTGTGNISVADNSVGNLFKRNVYLYANIGTRIHLGNSNNARSEFEPEARIVIDSTNYDGDLFIRGVIYKNSDQLDLKLKEGSYAFFSHTEFQCPVFCRAADITITGDYNKFFQKAIFHKTGTSVNTWSGTTDFFDDFELKNEAGGNIIMGTAGSVFNFYKMVDLYRNGSGRIDLAHGNFNFYGDVRYDLNVSGTLGMAQTASFINFIGSGDQSFVSNKTSVNINNVTINKPSGKLYSSFSWNFASGTNVAQLNLQKGIIRLDSSFFIRIIDNMTVTGGNAASFVEGTVSKQGDDAFTFPVGKNGKYAPVSMSAPAGNETYDVEYFRQPSDDHRFTPPVSVLSPCEYWNIKKTSSGVSTISVSIPWNAATCSPIKPDSMFLALNTGTGWQKIGNTTVSGSVSNGSISTPVMTSLGMITYAYTLLPSISNQINYCRLIKGNDHLQLYKIPTDTLHFSYESRYGSVSGQLDYRLVDYRGTMLLSKNELSLTEHLGNNSYSIDLAGLSLESNKLYMLEVRNQKNELYRMKFLIRN